MAISDLDRQVEIKRAELADLERRRSFGKGALTASEMVETTQEQAHYDPTYRGLGLGPAPGRLSGELPREYSARLSEGVKRYVYSPNLKKLDMYRLSTIDGDAFKIFAGQIKDEADRRAADRTWAGPDPEAEIRERKVADQSGREWSEFCGPSTLSWMRDHMMPAQRLKSVINSRGDLITQYSNLTFGKPR